MSDSKKRALLISLGIHGMLVCFWLVLVFAKRSRPEKTTFDFTVIENPTLATQPRPKLAPPRTRPAPKVAGARKVFGVTRNSLTSESPASIDVKLGNTLAKTPDSLTLKPEDQDSLPIPADEFEVSEMPRLIQEYRVPYPPGAKARGVQGSVLLELLIDAQGQVRRVVLIKGIDPDLDRAAEEGIARFRFSPAKIENDSVAVVIRYSYRFVLEK